MSIVALVKLGRPVFLLGGLALYGLGALTAIVDGRAFDPAGFVLGQFAVTSIQLMTHYCNDYFDYHADLANTTPTRWSGGSRVLVRGELARGIALEAAITMAVLAGLAIVGLWWVHPELALPSLLCGMLILAWSYSAPPMRLHARGWGEPTVVVVVPLLTPCVGFLVQAETITSDVLLLSMPLCLLQLVMLLGIEVADAAGDRSVGKRTWVVRLGAHNASLLCRVLLPVAALLGLGIHAWGLPYQVTLAWLGVLPLVLALIGQHRARAWADPKRWPSLAFLSVATYFVAITAELLGLALHAAQS